MIWSAFFHLQANSMGLMDLHEPGALSVITLFIIHWTFVFLSEGTVEGLLHSFRSFITNTACNV